MPQQGPLRGRKSRLQAPASWPPWCELQRCRPARCPASPRTMPASHSDASCRPPSVSSACGGSSRSVGWHETMAQPSCPARGSLLLGRQRGTNKKQRRTASSAGARAFKAWPTPARAGPPAAHTGPPRTCTAASLLIFRSSLSWLLRGGWRKASSSNSCGGGGGGCTLSGVSPSSATPQSSASCPHECSSAAATSWLRAPRRSLPPPRPAPPPSTCADGRCSTGARQRWMKLLAWSSCIVSTTSCSTAAGPDMHVLRREEGQERKTEGGFGCHPAGRLAWLWVALCPSLSIGSMLPLAAVEPSSHPA